MSASDSSLAAWLGTRASHRAEPDALSCRGCRRPNAADGVCSLVAIVLSRKILWDFCNQRIWSVAMRTYRVSKLRGELSMVGRYVLVSPNKPEVLRVYDLKQVFEPIIYILRTKDVK